jgi:hypothetical protein
MIKFMVLVLLSTVSLQAAANFQSDFMAKKKPKSTSGEGVHWTLADWLSQKNKVSLMDQWLAAHRTNKWWDTVLSGGGQQYTFKTGTASSTTSTSQTGQNYQADVYLSILNLNGEYQKTNDGKESYNGALGLHLLGESAQSTGLVGRYGSRHLADLTTEEKWDNQYVEGMLQLYIIEEFGVTSTYRYYFPSTSNQGDSLSGHKVSFGVYFEFSALRIFADYYQEPLQLAKNGVVTSESSDGFDGGLKLFF